MIKYLKYLILLFLTFALTVNDCTFNSQSNSDDYYQSSNVILRRENYKDPKTYVFGQVKSSKKALFAIPLEYLRLQNIYSLQIGILQKTQRQLYQKISLITTQYIFINELITSKNIYIA